MTSLYSVVGFHFPVISPFGQLLRLLIDNSRSMKTSGKPELLEDTLLQVADFACELNPEGISLRFLHSAEDGKLNHLNHERVKEALSAMEYYPGTPLGTKVKEKIVEPMVTKTAEGLKRPLIAVIITDGEVSARPLNIESRLIMC
jgi:hypothetical protein